MKIKVDCKEMEADPKKSLLLNMEANGIKVPHI